MSNIMEGAVGVVQLKWNGVDYGKTTAATEITVDKDWLDIIYQQTGTKPDDKIETGIIYLVNATFGELDTDLVAAMVNGVTKTADNTLTFGKNVYTSLKTSKGKKLELFKVDSLGVMSTNAYDKILFYTAVPEVTGAINWDAGAQKNLAVTFHCFGKAFTNSKTAAADIAFGYMGIASSAGLPNS